MAKKIKNFPLLLKSAFNGVASLYDEDLFMTKTVKELAFDGYKEPIVNFIQTKFKFMAPILPNATFGFFYESKISDDGLFKVHTGKKESANFTIIEEWNNESHLNYWKSKYCNMLNGTDGGQFPPSVSKKDVLYTFSTDLCRSLHLTYEKNVDHHGISTYRFIAPEDLFADPRTFAPNKCYCTTKPCFGKGLLDISSCKKGAPVVMSSPHFYQAAKEYQDAVVGLTPDKTKHETLLDVEPNTGAVLKAAKRVQINVHIEPSSSTWYVQFNLPIPISCRSRDTNLNFNFEHKIQSATKYLRQSFCSEVSPLPASNITGESTRIHNVNGVKVMRNMEHVNEIVFPILWVEEGATINEKSAKKFKDLVFKPKDIVYGVVITLVVLGCIVLIIAIILVVILHKKEDKFETAKKSYWVKILAEFDNPSSESILLFDFYLEEEVVFQPLGSSSTFKNDLMEFPPIRLSNPMMFGTVKGSRPRGRPVRQWADDIKEWAGGIEYQLMKSAENRSYWTEQPHDVRYSTKRPKGRPVRQWADDIKEWAGGTEYQLMKSAENRNYWRNVSSMMHRRL
ncbi:Lysosome membrane protein 2 [Nymphon striatum]|nr:Lysosome membrane protein 2 [Nymphon striatum]